MSMSAHRHEVATFSSYPPDDFRCWIAESQVGVRGNSLRAKFGPDFFEVGGVFVDFTTDRIASVSAGGPAIGNVEQHDTAGGELCERLDVLDDGAIGRRAVKSEQNGFIHYSASVLLADDDVPGGFERLRQTVNIHG